MTTYPVRALVFTILSCVAVSASAVDLRPNLKALQAADIRLVTTSTGSTLLRFSTTSWNSGTGPLELVAGSVDRSKKRQKVYQRIYADDGSYRNILAGFFVWHKQHNHFHFENYADYILEPVNAPGASSRTSSKTTFCVMDTTDVNLGLDGAPQAPFYSTCGRSVQGMSVGWGDTYKYYLSGQEIDVTDLPPGDYLLKIVVDPKNRLLESNDTDNTCVTSIRLSGDTVSVVSSAEDCRRF
jgi:hypothetical protein